MILEVDGKRIEVLNDVKVIWDDIPLEKDPILLEEGEPEPEPEPAEGSGEIHLKATYEGIFLETILDGEIRECISFDRNQLTELIEETP